MLDPTVVVHSSESGKTSDLTSIMLIQPKKLFHLDITREATTPPNGQPHVRVGAVLPKWWTLIAFEPTASMMLTDSQAAVAAYIFSDTLDPSEELVISDEIGYRSTFRCLVPERRVESRRYALSDKYTPVEVISDFLVAYVSLKISHVTRAIYLEAMLDDHIFDDDKSKVVDCSTFWPMTPSGLPTQKNRSNDSGVWVTSWMRECTLKDDFNIQVNDSTRMRLAVDLVLEEHNDLCLVIQENAWQYRTRVEAEHEDIWE
ncbi:hypothetical protein HN873_051575 [Arachis hypogaea]